MDLWKLAAPQLAPQGEADGRMWNDQILPQMIRMDVRKGCGMGGFDLYLCRDLEFLRLGLGMGGWEESHRSFGACYRRL